MRRELMGLMKKAQEVVEDLKLKVHGMSEELGEARRELELVRERYAFLKTAEQSRNRSQEKSPA